MGRNAQGKMFAESMKVSQETLDNLQAVSENYDNISPTKGVQQQELARTTGWGREDEGVSIEGTFDTGIEGTVIGGIDTVGESVEGGISVSGEGNGMSV